MRAADDGGAPMVSGGATRKARGGLQAHFKSSPTRHHGTAAIYRTTPGDDWVGGWGS